jgi:molecular chaperone GrpE (heat shock protein)
MGAVQKFEANMKANNQETRIALLEQSIKHVNETLLRFEKKIDGLDQKVEQNMSKINDRLWSNFLWILTTLFTLSTLLIGVMAKGFHWLN